jgi:Domain of unknown function (DUF4157)/Protein-glutamine gamma-glutamyltransferase/Annexin
MNATRQICPTPVRTLSNPARTSLMSRKCACGGKERETCEECSGQKLQARLAGSREPQAIPPSVGTVLQGSGEPLDQDVRAHFEARLGHDFGAVRIHNDTRAHDSARDVNALAYTVGPHVAFAAGQYQPTNDTGRRLIAHELVHTVQQGPLIDRTRKLAIEPADSPAEAEAERIAGQTSSVANASVARHAGINVARQEREVPLPNPVPPTPQDADQADKLKNIGRSKPENRLGDTWGWGAPETKNVYQECQIAELDRQTFVALFTSISKASYDKPADANYPLGITWYEGDPVAPQIAAQPFTEDGKTIYKLKPTHAEMPTVRSAATASGEFEEGIKQYLGNECQKERNQFGRRFPIHWTITVEGAQKIKEGEQEHCNDIRLAFDWTLGRYASSINNLAAANRDYSSERQAIIDAVKFVGLQPSEMLPNFKMLVQKSQDRDRQAWHTANYGHPQTLAHQEGASDANGCRQKIKIDATSFPEIGGNKHPSEAVLTATRQADGGKSGGRQAQATTVIPAAPMRVGHDFALMRVEATSSPSPKEVAPVQAAPTLPIVDYADLADRIYKAIAGLGTDEEAVYRALEALNRDQSAIDELKRVYQHRHNLSLVEDIRDDFSGGELEYALQLLNMGRPDSAQRIQSGGGATDAIAAARRIRQAVEGPGTDEEAVYATLLPFKRSTLAVQSAYHDQFHEDLRDRISDEMSGSELDYALSLLETPYEHYLHEGNALLAGAPFGRFGNVQLLCMPQERDMSSGTARTYWYDRRYWEPGRELTSEGGQQKTTCKVTLLSGKSAAEAIDQMFNHQDRWLIACAEFVQIVHLYALRRTLGAKRFDETVGKPPFTLEIKRRQSTGVRTDVTFTRTAPNSSMVRSDTGAPDPRNVDAILAEAPIGTRVRWTSLDDEAQGTPWQNENTIKLGPDKFGAHGTADGIFTKVNTGTRAEVELMTALGTNPHADLAYVRKNIFISEIEVFRNPE